MSKTLKAAIFDFDGTIINSIESAMHSFNFAIEKVGVGPFAPAQIKKYFGAGADRILKELIGDDVKSLEAFAAFKEHQLANANQVQLHLGIVNLLKKFHAAEVPMGIVTGRHSDDLEILMAPHDLSHFFQFLICDNHVLKSKPDPQGLFMAAKNLSLLPTQMMYIGDSVGDIEAAHRAGAISVAATWDQLVLQDSFRDCPPQYWAHSADEVWEIFQRI